MVNGMKGCNKMVDVGKTFFKSTSLKTIPLSETTTSLNVGHFVQTILC